MHCVPIVVVLFLPRQQLQQMVVSNGRCAVLRASVLGGGGGGGGDAGVFGVGHGCIRAERWRMWFSQPKSSDTGEYWLLANNPGTSAPLRRSLQKALSMAHAEKEAMASIPTFTHDFKTSSIGP